MGGAVSSFVGGGSGDTGGQADADEEGQSKGGDEADQGERKEFVGRGARRVIYEIVGCTPGICDGRREAEGEERYSVRGPWD